MHSSSKTSILFVCAFLVLPCLAQDPRGMIVGTVTDATASVVPGTQIQITNQSTGVRYTATANEAGRYVAPYLLPGAYELAVEHSGFKKFVRRDVQVRINDQVEVIIQLEVGGASETVSVRSETPLLATAESSLGQVIDERRIQELPLFAGNAMDLVHLAPGTVNGTNLRLRKAPFNNAPSQFSTDGTGNYQNEFMIDGVSNTYSDGTSPRVAFSPPQMAIAEFKVQTSAFDASLGRTIGSVVNVSTKSGSNEIHGEMHWWVRNRVFDAPTIFQNRSAQKLPVYQDNRYGASVGGPVVIPRLYNGKNRTFFFYAWEANKFGDPQVGQATSTVPTAAMRRGDFSDLLRIGGQYQVFDPATTTPEGNNFRRQPFAGNLIPASRLDPFGQKLINTWPLPNQAGTPDGRNNFFNTGKALEDYWVHLTRIDHAFSQNHRLFFRLHRDYWEEDKNRRFVDNITGIILNRVNRGVALDDVLVFSPSFLLQMRYGITQQDFPERRVSRGFDLASLGLAPNVVNAADKRLATFPRTRAGSLTPLSEWESGDGVTASITHAATANFTKLWSRHNVRFGPEFRVYREFRNRFPGDVSPDLNFDATFTRGPLNTNNAPPVGGEIASMLLGIPGGSMSRSASYAEQDKYLAFYVHDDFKVSPKLTLNIGLRYEFESPITERYNRSVAGYSFETSNPIEPQARANYARSPIPELAAAQFRVLGGVNFVGVGGNPRNYWRGESNNLMPRFGFAYQVLPKTVLRGGYGLFFNSIGVNQTNSIQIGFSQTTPIQASLDNGLTFQATSANPFPSGLIPPPGAAGGLTTNLGQGLSYFEPARRQGYAQRWSFGFQQEVPQGFVIEASYVANRSTRLPVNRESNAVPGQYLSTSPVRDQPAINFLNAQFTNPFFGLAPVYPRQISRAQLLRPYPHFGGITALQPIGYGWYHSLQSRIEKRFSKGFTFQLSYTFSKAMEAIGFLNDVDARLHEVVAQIDRPHRLTASGIWELPLGRGRRFGSGWHPAVNFIFGGWQLNGIMQRQSGEPLGFGNRILTGSLDQIALSNDRRSVDGWFRRDPQGRSLDFENNTALQLANNIRTLPFRFSGIRGPNQDRWDFGMIKNFKIVERVLMQFRAEAFNAWNHPNLSNPNTDPTSTSFGLITGQDSPRSWQMSLKLTF